MALKIEQCVSDLAKQFGLDEIALQLFTDGVISRINHYGIEKFKKLSKPKQIEILQAACLHYIESSKKMMEEYKNNTNGARDKLISDVYDELKGK